MNHFSKAQFDVIIFGNYFLQFKISESLTAHFIWINWLIAAVSQTIKDLYRHLLFAWNLQEIWVRAVLFSSSAIISSLTVYTDMIYTHLLIHKLLILLYYHL